MSMTPMSKTSLPRPNGTVCRSQKSDKLIIEVIGDFHNSDFDMTFEDVMMFDLQNIHDDLTIQTKPLIHQNFENMR